MDIGECANIHDLALRADYEKASESKDYGYQVDVICLFICYFSCGGNGTVYSWRLIMSISLKAMDHLTSFVGECDRKTEAAKKRLAETQEELSAEVAAKAQKVRWEISLNSDSETITKVILGIQVHLLAEQIGQKLAKAEQLGAEGFVDESMKMMEEVKLGKYYSLAEF